jgi:hypothetical protein
MLVMEDDVAVALICINCGGSILSGQAFIDRDNIPVHSESGDCDPGEGSTPRIDAK